MLHNGYIAVVEHIKLFDYSLSNNAVASTSNASQICITVSSLGLTLPFSISVMCRGLRSHISANSS